MTYWVFIFYPNWGYAHPEGAHTLDEAKGILKGNLGLIVHGMMIVVDQ